MTFALTRAATLRFQGKIVTGEYEEVVATEGLSAAGHQPIPMQNVDLEVHLEGRVNVGVN